MLASKRFPPPFPQRPIVVPLPHGSGVTETEACDQCNVRRLLKQLEECM
jgi:hypothetical protein